MKIAIFAAGTGGHIYPALTIAKEFNKKDIIFSRHQESLKKKYLKIQNLKQFILIFLVLEEKIYSKN